MDDFQELHEKTSKVRINEMNEEQLHTLTSALQDVVIKWAETADPVPSDRSSDAMDIVLEDLSSTLETAFEGHRTGDEYTGKITAWGL